MANFTELKSSIANIIKANNNQEITGGNLQEVLNTIVNSIANGYLFKGVATPAISPGSPDQTAFWIGGAGVYSNFGSPVFEVPNGKLAVFLYNGTFIRILIDLFATAASIEDDDPSIATSGVVKAAIDEAKESISNEFSERLKDKVSIVELYGRNNSLPLPMNSAYYYKGVLTHCVSGTAFDGYNGVYTDYLGICIEHESDEGFEPQHHSVMLFTKVNGDYIYNKTFNTSEASDYLELHVARAFGSVNATTSRSGLMSPEDKQKLNAMSTVATYTKDGLMSSQDKQKLDECYRLIQELRNQG